MAVGLRVVVARARLGALLVGALIVGATSPLDAASARPLSPSGGSSASSVAVVDTPDLAAKGWVSVFEDEFASLDETRWHVREDEGNRRDAVTVSASHPGEPSDGFLRLKTYTESGRHYNGGIVGDGNDKLPHGLFNATYGYLEARIKFENQSGTTSDFWSLGAQGNRAYGDPGESGPETGFEHTNPASGDLDSDGQCDPDEECNTQPVGILGWDGYQEDDHAVDDRVANPNPGGTPVLQGNFHTYGLLWAPEGWRYFIDGKQVFETTAAVTYRPEFLLLTQQVSGGWAGAIPASYGDVDTSTNQTFVDYVKVWQRPISEVPDQMVGANQALAVPFTVTDYFYAEPGTAEPDSVRVTASSSDTTLLPDANLVVTGNGPADPDGSLANASFSSTFSAADWAATGAATRSTTRYKTTPGGLRLDTAGGEVTQTVTGLQPDTTYAMGGWTDLEIDWNDTDGDGLLDWNDADEDGQYDTTETGETVTDALARFDWGVRDVDASRAGDQTAKLVSERNSWTLRQNGWIHDYLTFTTGPTTTQVTLFLSNQAHASNGWDSKVSFDDVYLRPIVPPERTVAIRAEDGTSGTATVTLTARDENDTVLGTEDFDVTVTNTSFTNGGFEALPEGAGWEQWYGDPAKRLGVDIVVDDPFSRNRVMQLAQPPIVDPRGPGQPGNYAGTIGTAFQRVTGLEPNAAYTLEVRAKGTDLRFTFQGALIDATHPDPCVPVSNCQIIAGSWTTKSITFTTDGTGKGNVVLLDWSPGDAAASFVDSVKLTRAGSPAASAAPGLTSLGEQRLTSSAPAAIRFTPPAGTTITGATSDNPTLLPDRNVAVGGSGTQQVLTLTPVTNRTGPATVTVTYSGGGSHAIPVVVSDKTLEAPSFEYDTTAWAMSASGAAIVADNQRSGANALKVEGSGTATQRFVVHTEVGENGLHDWSRTFVVGGWGRNGATITVRELRTACSFNPTPPCGPQVIGTYQWSGAMLAYGQAVVHTGPDDCPACREQEAPIEIVVTDATPGDGAAYLDDLSFLHGPAMSPIRDLSLYAGQTRTDWESRTGVRIGRIPLDSRWLDPNLVTITSSNPPVVPLANIAVEPDARLPMTWSLLVTAPGTATGTSDVTVTLTDPRTAATTERTFTVSVSSGNFNNGAFQRGTAGWEAGWFPPWLYSPVALRPSARIADHDTVLRLEQGAVEFDVTDLQAGGSYVLTGRAFGSGASVTVRKAKVCLFCDNAITTQPFTVDATTGWQSFSVPFTVPADQTHAWISIEDFAAPPTISGNPCTTHNAGISCYDDLAVTPAP